MLSCRSGEPCRFWSWQDRGDAARSEPASGSADVSGGSWPPSEAATSCHVARGSSPTFGWSLRPRIFKIWRQMSRLRHRCALRGVFALADAAGVVRLCGGIQTHHDQSDCAHRSVWLTVSSPVEPMPVRRAGGSRDLSGTGERREGSRGCADGGTAGYASRAAPASGAPRSGRRTKPAPSSKRTQPPQASGLFYLTPGRLPRRGHGPLVALGRPPCGDLRLKPNRCTKRVAPDMLQEMWNFLPISVATPSPPSTPGPPLSRARPPLPRDIPPISPDNAAADGTVNRSGHARPEPARPPSRRNRCR